MPLRWIKRRGDRRVPYWYPPPQAIARGAKGVKNLLSCADPSREADRLDRQCMADFNANPSGEHVRATLYSERIRVQRARQMGVTPEYSYAQRLNSIAEAWDAPPGRSVVYFIRCGDYVKIGTTNNLSARLKHFMNANPYEFEVLFCEPGGSALEATYHAKLRAYRHHWEWFRLEEDVDQLIGALRVNAAWTSLATRPLQGHTHLQAAE